MEKVRTRFAPSPTGYLHVGGARTALFNYLLARRTGGTFLVRIEDTDRARHDEAAIARIVQDLRWLGIEWDEGIEVGGPNGPYRQSQRLDLYSRCVEGLLQAGKAYFAFETTEELDAMRARALGGIRPESMSMPDDQDDARRKVAAYDERKAGWRYPRPERLPTPEEAATARQQGRPVVVRFLCPRRDVAIRDDVFGTVTTSAEEMDDFVIRKDDGWPTYHLANVVDDALMGVTYVMRGQEFLGQTWRHVLLRQALGFPEPGYCHLPLILDMPGRKLSKRDGAVEVHAFRQAGYLPEALVNFIALLGWSPGGGREKLTLAEMVQSFSVERVNKANARFDRDKLLAFNTEAAASAAPERLLAALKDYLSLNATPIPASDQDLLVRLLEANKGFRTFADIVEKSGALFTEDEAFPYEEKAVKKVLAGHEGQGYAVLKEVRPALTKCAWTQEGLAGLIEGFCRRGGLSLGQVAQPIRVAVTGRTISPSIYDTLLILGRKKALARIDRCLKMQQPGRPDRPGDQVAE